MVDKYYITLHYTNQLVGVEFTTLESITESRITGFINHYILNKTENTSAIYALASILQKVR